MTLLKGIRVCVFDAYGTIFDFASAVGRCSAVPEQRRSADSDVIRPVIPV